MTDDSGAPCGTGFHANAPSPDGLGPSGFDPSRERQWFSCGFHGWRAYAVPCPACARAQRANELRTIVSGMDDDWMTAAVVAHMAPAAFVNRHGYTDGGCAAIAMKRSGLFESKNGTPPNKLWRLNAQGRALRDSDGSPKGRDAQHLDGEAATARAGGIAQGPSA